MSVARHFAALRGALDRFGRDRDGVSAVEFALILPFMVTLYVGSVELGDGLAIQFRTTLAARTVADLTSQYITIDSSTMTQILGAATTVLAPYSANNVVVTVSELTTTNAKGKVSVTWSASNSGSGRTVGSTFTLPTALDTLAKNTRLIYGEVTYPYTPTMGYVITGTINMYESMYFYPRQASCVTYNSAC
jgi:Flp pilus assembly protein TadG